MIKNTYILLALLFLTACATTKPITKSKDSTPNKFESLFDGKTLKGWSGLKKFWSVEDGAITGITTKDKRLKKYNTFLVHDKEVSDFELHFQYKLSSPYSFLQPIGNSGVQYRSQLLDKEKFIVAGYQADLDTGNKFTGILYDERGRGLFSRRGFKTVINKAGKKTEIKLSDPEPVIKNLKNGEWINYEILARGNHMIHKVNGVTTVELIDEQAGEADAKGILALQLHAGQPMKVQFRNIRIKRLN